MTDKDILLNNIHIDWVNTISNYEFNFNSNIENYKSPKHINSIVDEIVKHHKEFLNNTILIDDNLFYFYSDNYHRFFNQLTELSANKIIKPGLLNSCNTYALELTIHLLNVKQ